MITISKNAASQIELSAQQTGITNTSLRVAIRKLENGKLHYALGFDDAICKHDVQFKSQGIDLVISPESLDLGRELSIDFVQLDSGETNFIFINPADPNCNLPSDLVG